ncbi:hypothetical protein JXA84_02520, partial [candidate division WOR-3 bacterium]|nr:hypothetical protein [candidate division WOR-3 bacterium]
MSIELMSKVRIVGSTAQEETYLKRLQALGIIQIEDEVSVKVKEALGDYKDETRTKDSSNILSEIKSAESFLDKYSVPKSFLQSVVGEKLVLKTKELLKIVEDFDYKDVVLQVRDIEERMSSLKDREEKARESLDLLENWRDMDKPLEEITSGIFYETSAGYIPSKYENPDISPGVSQTVQKNSRQNSVLVIWKKEDREEVVQKLKSLEFEKVDLSRYR